MYQQMILVNLAVNDLGASKKFFTELGFTLNEQFSDDSTSSVVISDTIVLMIMNRERFGQFTKKPIADSSQMVETLLALSAESREKVDELVDKAIAAGGAPAGETQEQGDFMYGRAFFDPDGHHFEVVWMDPSVIES